MATEEKNQDTKKGTESKARTFTEKQVEEIINERLARDRRNRASLTKVRDMIMELARKGVIKQGSITEMGKELEALIGSAEKKQDNTPAQDAIPKEENADDRGAELEEFMRLFPTVNLEGLLSNEDFTAFIQGHKGTLSQMYADYILSSALKQEQEEERRRSKLISGLSSTGFSAKSSGGVDYSSLLTPNQIRIAKSCGMSCREYADYLSALSSEKRM